MRHRLSRLRLAAKPSHEKLLLRNLLTSILLYEKVRTTHKRAVVARALLDHLIASVDGCSEQRAVRLLNRTVTDRNASRKVMEVLRHRYAKRASGFSRIVPVGSRKGDGAKVVDWMLVEDGKQNSLKEKVSWKKV